ncbi:hypothetical protein [Microbacterium sp. XT11]|uniref:hypothetical protein n=1 Tax=Microbacterium sp. XT11 TaxID=367477 RepID=UPI000831A920|nr:hypothetical protein [Microbacterium sp. XT11]
MTLLIGKALDARYSVIDYRSTTVKFTLSDDPTLTAAGTFVADRPVMVATDQTGSFSVDLAPTTTMRGDRWYWMTLVYLDEAGNFVSEDRLPWKLRIPDAPTVTLDEAIDAPPEAGEVWVGATDNSDYQFWFNPDTQELRWE